MLRSHAEIQSDIYGFLDDADLEHAVVLADQFGQTWSRVPEYRRLGSWVFEWRLPRPDFSDDVLIFHDVRGARRATRRAFPDRARYRLSSHETEPFLRLTELP